MSDEGAGGRESPGGEVIVDVHGYTAVASTSQTGHKKMGGNDSTTSISEDSWNCNKCNKVFTKARSNIMECDLCFEHTCIKCAKLSVAEYKLMKREDIFWVCKVCVPKMTSLIASKQEGTEDEASGLNSNSSAGIATLMEAIDKKFEKLEEKIDVKMQSYTKEVPETMKKSFAEVVGKNKMNEPPAETVRKIVKNTMMEHKKDEKSRETREENIIIHRVPESNSEDPEERKGADTKFFQSLCTDVLGIQEPETKNILRIGKKMDNAEKPRPLKISMKTTIGKRKIMARLTNLKDAEAKFKNISVVDDLTQEERKQIKAKVEEAQEMEKSESEGGRWAFKVRGPPWDLRIVKLARNNTS